jgi:NAD(P)-dependent dehydrogenase (short-subunit alcohol dehydrogenase family)
MENYPSALPPQAQTRQPGLEGQMTPEPIYIRANYKGSEKLQNKVALITGGDSGIGRAVAVHFAREGADLALAYKPEEQADADDTRALVEAEGRRCVLLPGDLRSPEYCESLIAQTVQQLGKLNIVVSNAAEQFVSTDVAELPNEQFEDTFQVNFFALVRVVKAALPHLHAGDSIIATSSINAYRGNQQLVDYTSTKGAITAYIRSISQQLAEKQIRANTVAPGPIWTPLIPASFPPDKVAEFGQDTTMKRPGQPAEVAPAFVFLASEDASYITGQAIHPNGGEVLNT